MRILRRVILGQGCCTSRACCKAPQPGSSAHSWQLWLPRQSGPCCLSPWHVRMLERQRMSRQVTTQASLLAAVGLQRAGGCPMRINSRLPLTGIARKCLCSLSTDKQLPLGINSNPVIENNLAPAVVQAFSMPNKVLHYRNRICYLNMLDHHPSSVTVLRICTVDRVRVPVAAGQAARQPGNDQDSSRPVAQRPVLAAGSCAFDFKEVCGRIQMAAPTAESARRLSSLPLWMRQTSNSRPYLRRLRNKHFQSCFVHCS